MDNVVRLSDLSENEVVTTEEIKINKNSTQVFKRSTDDFELKFSEFLTREEEPRVYAPLSSREHRISPTRKFLRNVKDFFIKPVAVQDGTTFSAFEMLIEKYEILQVLFMALLFVSFVACYFLGSCIVPVG